MFRLLVESLEIDRRTLAFVLFSIASPPPPFPSRIGRVAETLLSMPLSLMRRERCLSRGDAESASLSSLTPPSAGRSSLASAPACERDRRRCCCCGSSFCWKWKDSEWRRGGGRRRGTTPPPLGRREEIDGVEADVVEDVVGEEEDKTLVTGDDVFEVEGDWEAVILGRRNTLESDF